MYLCICLHLPSFPDTLQCMGALHGSIHVQFVEFPCQCLYIGPLPLPLPIPLPKLHVHVSNCLPVVVSKQSFIHLKLNLIFELIS